MRVGFALAVLLFVAPAMATAIDSSELCGDCHQTIHDTWRSSAHARSLESPIFLRSYRDIGERHGAKATRVCLGCHAPLADENGDHALNRRITWEGVSCDTCHTLVSVDLSGSGPRRTLDPGGPKRGPHGDAAAGAGGHEVAYSELQTASLACAWCHEYANNEGTPILTTYSEFRRSRAAEEGRTCASCHMAATGAGVVDPRSRRLPGTTLNLHEMPGGHSIEQLNRALAVSFETVRDSQGLQVAVGLRNRGAGHAVPTGMPGRRVILAVELRTSDGRYLDEQRVYGKSFVNADAGPVVSDADHFLPGVSLASDSRLGPDETRRESFRFPVSGDISASLTIKLHYEHSPMGDEAGRTWLTFYSERRFLPGEAG